MSKYFKIDRRVDCTGSKKLDIVAQNGLFYVSTPLKGKYSLEEPNYQEMKDFLDGKVDYLEMDKNKYNLRCDCVVYQLNKLNGNIVTAAFDSKIMPAEDLLQYVLANGQAADPDNTTCNGTTMTEAQTEAQILQEKIDTIDSLRKILAEFDVQPQARFVNTLAIHKKPLDYALAYFKVTANPHFVDIEKKLHSPEFKRIIEKLQSFKVSRRINNRLEIFFGPAGSGKSTRAIDEHPNAIVVACSSSMNFQDLMEDFKLEDGKGSLKPGAFIRAIDEDRPVVLDEGALLSYPTLQGLQSLLDGKKEFQYKGTVYPIGENFKVIITMNLETNDGLHPLPEALVDRAYNIEEVISTSELIAKYSL